MRIGRGFTRLYALSPSGRFAVVLPTSREGSYRENQRAALVDLQRRKVRVLARSERLQYFDEARWAGGNLVWSRDERQVVLPRLNHLALVRNRDRRVACAA